MAHRLHFQPGMDLLRIFLSIVFPPLGVFMRVGLSMHLLLSVVLTMLGYVPGLVHAIWVLIRFDDQRYTVQAW